MMYISLTYAKSLKAVLHWWADEVIPIFGRPTQFKNQVVTGFRQSFFFDIQVDILDLLAKSCLVLASWQVRVVKSYLTASNHRNFQAVGLFNVVEELLERDAALVYSNLVVNREALGNGFDWSAHYGVVVFALGLFDIVGFTKHEKRKGQVNEGVSEFFDRVEALDKLEHFDADYSGDHCGSRGDGGDNFAGDHLGLAVVAFVDLVVACSEAGDSVDEVNVEICVIIFFELCALDLSFANNLGVVGKQIMNFSELTFIVFRTRLLGCWLFSFLSCLLLFRCLNFNLLRNVRFAGDL